MRLNALLERLRYLDRRVILSGGLALLIAVGLLGLALIGPAEARFGATVGLVGLLVAMQIAILFFRPADRSPLGLARSAFIAGDFEKAASQLEGLIAAKPSASALTLLGNTYRQLGRLPESQTQLERALNIAPKNPFALYGLGRTALAFGNFDGAAERFDQALSAGAPAAVGCDLGFAEYFAGNFDAALSTLQKTTRLLQVEPYRALLASALLYSLIKTRQSANPQQSALPVTRSDALSVTLHNMRRAADGLAYWQAEAARHQRTPYGQALTAILPDIEQLLSTTSKGEMDDANRANTAH